MLNGFSPSLSKTISQTFGKLLKNDFAYMLPAILYFFIVTLRNCFIGFSYSSARVELASVLSLSSISFWCLSRVVFPIILCHAALSLILDSLYMMGTYKPHSQ